MAAPKGPELVIAIWILPFGCSSCTLRGTSHPSPIKPSESFTGSADCKSRLYEPPVSGSSEEEKNVKIIRKKLLLLEKISNDIEWILNAQLDWKVISRLIFLSALNGIFNAESVAGFSPCAADSCVRIVGLSLENDQRRCNSQIQDLRIRAESAAKWAPVLSEMVDLNELKRQQKKTEQSEPQRY